jgi:arylamine N-acetyltransferase
MTIPALPPELTREVLAHLGVESGAPTLALLDELLTAYPRTVPWESAFRIARRAQIEATADCPRWPDLFWDDALNRGGGGTCFESNYAFFSLLRALGYDGYLTVNNMRDDGTSETPSIGCHSAIVLSLDGGRWLADMGLPVYVALPIDPDRPTQRQSPFHTYTLRPDGEKRYQVERDRHPSPNCFTLIDVPVNNHDYRARLTRDYDENGLFLDAVIVNKIVDGCQWRFNARDFPLRIEENRAGERIKHPLTGDVAARIARRFDIDRATVATALAVTRGSRG